LDRVCCWRALRPSSRTMRPTRALFATPSEIQGTRTKRFERPRMRYRFGRGPLPPACSSACSSRAIEWRDDVLADVADSGLARLNWAENPLTRAISGRTGLRPKADTVLRARTRLHRPVADISFEASVILSGNQTGHADRLQGHRRLIPTARPHHS
jgi:hypothetical protein